MSSNPIITFTSDFGSREQYVGAVKGVLLSSCPSAVIVDISHDIGAHDLLEASFVLSNAYPFYPPRTVHLVVVDPTVGSSRRPLVAIGENAIFVAPDNGVLSLVYAREPEIRVLAIDAEHYFRKPASPTFHARDVFAPVAAALAKGVDPLTFGPQIKDYVRFALPAVRKAGDKALEGIVLHIDRFGNVITNITPGDLGTVGPDAKPRVFKVNGKPISSHRRYYAESNVDELFSLVGSSGYFEISALRKPAARLLEAKRGIKVELETT